MLARKNEVYVGLFDGKRRTVKEVTDNFVTFDDGSEFTNLEAFKLVEKAPVEKVQKEDVQVNGGLKIDGKDIETGTLNVLELVSNQKPGKLLLTVESLEKGYVDLFEYNIEKDKFEKVLDGINTIEEIFQAKEGTLFITKRTETFKTEVLEDGEEKTVDVKHNSQSLFIYNNDEGTPKKHIFVRQPIGDVIIKNDIENQFEFVFVSDKKYEMVEDVYGTEYAVLVPHDAEERTITQLMVRKEKEEDEEDNSYFGEIELKVFEIKEELLKVETTYCNNNSLLVITKEGIIFTNNGFSPRHAKGKDVVETALEFPHFVKLKPGTKHNEFVLANKKGDVATIKVTKTDDRGYVTEIIR